MARIVGTDGNNTLEGTGSDDELVGRGGHDLLLGRGGNDELHGGPGNDTMTGGNGKDTFVFQAASDMDIVTDWQPGEDVLMQSYGGSGATVGVTYRNGHAYVGIETPNGVDEIGRINNGQALGFDEGDLII